MIERALEKVHRVPEASSFPRSRDNRVRVIMTLDDPPLAAATYARRFAGLGPNAKLNFSSRFSRSYLSSLEAAQAKAIAELREEIPEARVSRRYQVLVNGFAVSVPYARLPDLLETDIAERVYPSLTYTQDLNRGPSVIGTPAFGAVTGARGEGVKVAVVDDGVDNEHPFLDPTGFSYPPGFPKGTGGGTSPKVIAARGFAGPGGTGSVLNRDVSFHGTFVAGIIAGVPTDVEAGRRGLLQRGRGRVSPGGRRRGRGRPACADRELPRLQRPCPLASGRVLLGQQPGDRRRVRGCGARRDGRHQLLGRRPAGGSPHRRSDSGRDERRPCRGRADHLGRQRP